MPDRPVAEARCPTPADASRSVGALRSKQHTPAPCAAAARTCVGAERVDSQQSVSGETPSLTSSTLPLQLTCEHLLNYPGPVVGLQQPAQPAVQCSSSRQVGVAVFGTWWHLAGRGSQPGTSSLCDTSSAPRLVSTSRNSACTHGTSQSRAPPWAIIYWQPGQALEHCRAPGAHVELSAPGDGSCRAQLMPLLTKCPEPWNWTGSWPFLLGKTVRNVPLMVNHPAALATQPPIIHQQ